LERYGIRFQIEFLFRDAKQFLGLAYCQSTHETKIENHVNLALSTVSVAKAAYWLPIPKDQMGRVGAHVFAQQALKNEPPQQEINNVANDGSQ
jgi:hypothetical protein